MVHCNLKPPDVMPVVLCLNYKAHTKIEVNQPFHC